MKIVEAEITYKRYVEFTVDDDWEPDDDSGHEHNIPDELQTRLDAVQAQYELEMDEWQIWGERPAKRSEVA